MPAQADPELALRLAKELADLYGSAVDRMLATVAKRLARGIDRPGWAEAKLIEQVQLRNEAQAIVAQLTAQAPAAVTAAVEAAWEAGATSAVAEVGATFGQTNTRAVQALVDETVTAVQSTHGQILRSSLDAYRAVIAEASGGVLTGTETRRQAAQRALDRFAQRGITGLIDRSGRRWSAETYAEMATRTAVGRAQVAGSLDRYQAAGRDLVIVSDAPQECERCRPWEGRILSISGTDARYPSVAAAQGAGLQHANCFPGDVLATGPAPVAGYGRWYEGDLVVIETASGVELPVTPNHPVLTPGGWVAAGDLREGQHVLNHGIDVERPVADRPHGVQAPAAIGQVVRALRESPEMATMSVPATAEQFHGDGAVDGQVEVVRPHRLLCHHGVPSRGDALGDVSLDVGGVGLGALLAERASGEVLVGALHAAHGVVGSGDLGGPLLGRHPSPLARLGIAPADLSASLDDPATDRGLADAEGGRQLRLALSGPVALDEIVHVGRRHFAGHVYNLQTAPGWYAANGIVVHNCRHSMGAYIEGLTRPLKGTEDPEGDRARQEQRRLERGIRQWKRRQAVAMDDDARRMAERHVRQWQARLRSHVGEHDLKRLPARERLGAR